MGRPKVIRFDASAPTASQRCTARRVTLQGLACGLTAVALGGILSAGALGMGAPTVAPIPPHGSPAPVGASSARGGASQALERQSPPTTSTPEPQSGSPGATPQTRVPAPTGSDVAIVLRRRPQRTTVTGGVSPRPSAARDKPTRGKTLTQRVHTNGGTAFGPTGSARAPHQAGAGATTSGPTNVAPAPQLVSGQAGLAAVPGSSIASMQALGFYRIPLFLLPIFRAAASKYNLPWQILAAINEIETNYGADLSVSSAGAVGWMQFMPATWLQYGVDALDAEYADPYNPVDAIFAAARYLRAAGAATDLHAAILAYNHSEEYLSSVLLRAELISSYPKSMIATLTGLAGGRLPVAGTRLAWSAAASTPLSAAGGAMRVGEVPTNAPNAGAGWERASSPRSSTPGSTPGPPPAAAAAAAVPGSAGTSGQTLESVDLAGAPNAPVVAVQDGRIVGLGYLPRLGRYLVLRDVYGDLFMYAGLGSVATSYVLPKPPRPPLLEAARADDSTPLQPAITGRQAPLTLQVGGALGVASPTAPPVGRWEPAQVDSTGAAPAGMNQIRLFAHPGNPDARAAAALAAGRSPHSTSGPRLPLRLGAVVATGTVLGRVRVPLGARDGHLRFAIRPSGDPGTIDPAPILANWRQLEAALHPQGAKAQNALLGATASDVFLMPEDQLEAAVLSDPGSTLDRCARRDIASGSVDRRLLAVLVFLSRSGLRPSVTGPGCDPGRSPAASGTSFSEGRRAALEISAVDGIPVAGHQGPGTITDLTIRTLLALPSGFVPREIISLMRYPGAPNTHARASHSAFIELAFLAPPRAPALNASTTTASVADSVSAGTDTGVSVPPLAGGELSAAEWDRLVARIAALPVPTVARKPSPSAIPDAKGN